MIPSHKAKRVMPKEKILKKKVLAHLKSDSKEFKKQLAEDKKLKQMLTKKK